MTILVLTGVLGVAMVAASFRASQSQRRAETAEAQARERSWHAFVAQARAERLSPLAGHRARALAAIGNAAALRLSVELRDEAIASFALRDLEIDAAWPWPRGAANPQFDPALAHYAVQLPPGELALFRLADNARVRTFRAADAGLPTNAVVRHFTLSPVAGLVVAGFSTGEFALWDATNGALRHVLGRGAGQERLAWPPTFAHDDRTLCARSATRSNAVLFVDLAGGPWREVTVPRVDQSLQLNRQGDLLAWWQRTNLFLHDARDGSLQATIPWPANVRYFNWDAQGRHISVGCGDGTLNVVEVKTGRVRQFGGKMVGSWVQHFSPDGTMLATSGLDGTTRLWDVPEARLLTETTEAHALGWGADPERIAFTVPDRQVGVWRLTRPPGYRTWTPQSDAISAIFFQDLSPDGRWMAMTPLPLMSTSVFELFPLAGGGPSLLVPGRGRVQPGFHPVEPRLYVASGNGLHFFHLPEPKAAPLQLGRPEKVFQPGSDGVWTFSFSADGRRAALVDTRSRLLVLDFDPTNRVTVLEGTVVGLTLPGPASMTGAGALAISPDGRWVAAGRATSDGRATIWDATTGRVAHQFTTEPTQFAFSPDGRGLFGAGVQHATLWEAGSWKTVWTRRRGPLVDLSGAAAFTGDGSTLALAQTMGVVELVEAATGEHIANVAASTPVTPAGLRFSKDGRTLAAAGNDGRIHGWDLAALRRELARLGLDWPLAARPPRAVPGHTLPLVVGGAGLLAVVLAGVLGYFALRRHVRLAREFVEATETAARLHESERAAQLALGQEKELSRLKSHFVTTVSHEFRTPLGVIMSSAENLHDYRERLSAAQRNEQLRDIIDATRTMSGLMEEVLLLGRVESGKVAFRPAPLDLAALCERLVDEVHSATSRRCPIQLRVAPAERAARGDEGLLRHILVNLLTNAVKYSPAGRPVELRVAPDEAFAVFTLRDRGVGIAPEDLPHLFDAFHRGRNVGDTPGSGLGLVIVKRCVDLHGGTIECASRLNEGTTFTVRLPLFTRL